MLHDTEKEKSWIAWMGYVNISKIFTVIVISLKRR